MPYDYYTDQPETGVGLLNLHRTILDELDTAATTLLFDNGDFMQGTPMSDMTVPDPAWLDQHMNPVVEVMNAIGYDAVALGNHEFNFGLGVLDHALRDLACPALCANVLRKSDGAPYVSPWVILDRHIGLSDGTRQPIRIGVIGFAPPQIETWDALVIGDTIKTADIVETAEFYIPVLKAQGADLIVALCHSGIGSAVHTSGMENAAVPLAALDGIDALVLGHTHEDFPSPNGKVIGAVDPARGTLHGKPAVMPGAEATSLGLIDLDLCWAGNQWKVDGARVTTCPIREADEVPLMGHLPHTGLAHSATLDRIRSPIGQTDVPLQSYFALVDNCRTIGIVADAQRHAISTALTGTLWADLPLLSAAAPFKAGGRLGTNHYVDIPAGPLAIRNAMELYLYPNTVCAAQVTGAGIAAWLERAAGLFLQIKEGEGPHKLINPDFPSYNFDVIYGVTYQIDLTQPSRFTPKGELVSTEHTRIRNLQFNGQPIDPEARFVIATNSYRMGGGGYFFGEAAPHLIIDTRHPTRLAVVDHFKQKRNAITPPANPWSFVPVPCAVGLFPTGDGALAHATSMAGRRLVGFHRDADGTLWGELDLSSAQAPLHHIA